MMMNKVYLVGGAVRDRLLEREVKDRDWVVTGATPEIMTQQGFKPVGKSFPVFLHPETGEEYALARTERKISKGYHGFEFNADPNVTLEEDLARRDLTINAIAEDDQGRLYDPFNGLDDIENRYLRHVSDAFAEDPVRILRVARFAARYHSYGFTIADETLQLMIDMVEAGEVDALVAERVWQETEKALSESAPEVFFETLRACGALKILFPEVDRLFGVPQKAEHHPEVDTGIHTMMVLQQSVILQGDSATRFAALTHDLGKGLTPKESWPSHHDHEERGVALVEVLCERYKVPKQFSALAVMVSRYHTHCHRALDLQSKKVVKLYDWCDAYRRPARFRNFLLACEADSKGRTGFEHKVYPQRQYLSDGLDVCMNVDVKRIIEEGYKGQAIKEQLYQRRISALKASRLKEVYNQ